MNLYLVQHGKAKSKDENPDRPLTDEGRKEVEAVMFLMMRYNVIMVSRVLHSGKLRAAETAQLIGAKLDVDVEESDGLSPTDDPAILADRLAADTEDIMIVGHLPHLPRLASLLLSGDPDAGIVEFSNGGIVCLNNDDGNWVLRWSVPPALVS